MPTLSVFFGIIVRMYYSDHMPPHFHAYYQGRSARFDFEGNLLSGDMPERQQKLIAAWALIHNEDLEANWSLARDKEGLFRIEPLR